MGIWRRRFASVVAAVAAAAVGAGGCTGGDSTQGRTTVSEFRVGVLAPLTGPNQGAGKDAKQGALLAADMINGLNPSIPLPLAGSAGLPHLGGATVRVVIHDSKSDAQVGADATNELIGVSHVNAVVGAYDPVVTKEASQRAERFGIPFVNADSSAFFLTDRGLDWFFRLGASVRTTGQNFFAMMQPKLTSQQTGAGQAGNATNGRLAAQKVAVVYTTDNTGNDVATQIKRLATEEGYDFKPYAVAPGTTGFTKLINQVKAGKPEAVFVAISAQTMPALLTDFVTQKYLPNGVFAFRSGYLDPALLANAGPAISGVCREVAWSTELGRLNPAAKEVANLYQRKYGVPMTEEAAATFTAVLTLAEAANNGQSVDAKPLRSALLSLDVPGEQTIMPWQGIRFDESQQNTGAQSIIEQFVGTGFRVVWPTDAASNPNAFLWPASLARGVQGPPQ
jgi:branched-chain amino acid transport system substrate-binding protein